MTHLRQRMIEDLQLRGLSEKTQKAYVRAVRQLAEHSAKSPDQITEEELRQYFLYFKNVNRLLAVPVRLLCTASSSYSSIRFAGSGQPWIWCAPLGKRDCRSCSVWRRCDRCWVAYAESTTGSV